MKAQDSTTRDTTNEKFVRDLMNSSRAGGLSQVFILDAIQKHARDVALAAFTDKERSASFISLRAWQEAARDIDEKISARFGEPDWRALQQKAAPSEPPARSSARAEQPKA